jgi:hypothetical protein
MISYPWGALYVGAMLSLAGVLTLARHFLFEPISGRYPKAPVFVRHAMFGFGAILIFLGLQFIMTFAQGGANTIPPQPTPAMQFLATALVLYKGTMLGNVVRQRYPEDVWNRLNRISESLHCGDRPILRWFSR